MEDINQTELAADIHALAETLAETGYAPKVLVLPAKLFAALTPKIKTDFIAKWGPTEFRMISRLSYSAASKRS
jgi:hypothetical protein